MATVTFKGAPARTLGRLPLVGSRCPAFRLTGVDLQDLTLEDFAGQRVILNIFPSLDTPICADSVRVFNERATEAAHTVVLCVSMDLPFAHQRFCGTQGIARVIPASAFRSPGFGVDFGVQMAEGSLSGLLARAVIVLDEYGTVVCTQLVPELTDEPDYELAIGIIRDHHHACPEDAALTWE